MRRTGTLGVVGFVVIVLSFALAAVAVAQVVGVAVGRGTRLAEAAVEQGPFEEQVRLDEGTWTLYQCESGPRCLEPITVERVLVDSADGARLTVRPDSGGDTITRGTQDFSAVARVEVPADGTYVVVVPARTQFVLAPSLTSVVAPSLIWVAVALLAGLGLLIGIALLVAGLVLGSRARRRPAAAPADAAMTPVPAGPAAGWYPDPDPGRPGGLRYWSGSAWTEHTA